MADNRKRLTRGFIRILLITAWAVLAPLPVLAASYMFPIGHIEPAMGNNGIAGTGSPSGVFYNPSLLGTIEQSSLSASGSSYFVIRSESEGANAVKLFSLNSVPHTMVATWKMGAGALAFSVFVPESYNLDAKGTIPNPNTTVTGADTFNFSTSSVQQRTLIGPSWGQTLLSCGADCSIQVGGTLYFSYGNLKRSFYTESSDGSTGGLLVASSGTTTTNSLLPILGVTLRASKEFSWGVRVDFPGVLLKTEKTGEQVSFVYTSATSPATFGVSRAPTSDSPPALPQWGLGTGIEWKPNGVLTFIADANISERSKALENGTPSAAPVDAGGGVRIALNQDWSIMTGMKFDLTSVTTKPDDAEYRSIGWLISGGVSWVTKSLESSIGLFTIRPIILDSPSVPSAEVVFNESKTDFFGAILSGVYRF